MRDYKGYQIVSIAANIDEDKLKKAVRSGKITLKAEELKGSKKLLVHPANAKTILKAQAKNKGITSMMLIGSDILIDIELHGDKSIWKWLEEYKKKKAYNWMFDQE